MDDGGATLPGDAITSNGTANNTAATQLAAPPAPSTAITDKNPLANQTICNAFDAARQKALTVQLSRDSEFFKYQVSAAFAANCVGKMIDYAHKLSDAVAVIQTAATAGNPIQAAITIIAHQILNAVFRQIVNSLMNQICSITNQITQAMDSFINNAICIPSGNLGLGGLFNFNVNLNLPNLQCDGIAINPLALTEIDPATGQPQSQAEGNYARGAISTYGSGGYGASSRSQMTAFRSNQYAGTGADLSDELDPLDVAGDSAGVVGTVGVVSGTGAYKCFDMSKAIQYALSHATDGYQGNPPNGHCAVGVRMALCAGGMKQFCSGGHGDAKDYGSSLVPAGYVLVGNESSASISLQPGCIIIDAAAPGHPYGHIQMFAGGNTWVSDFKTTNMYGGSSYAKNKNFDMYCPSSNLNQNGNGTCK